MSNSLDDPFISDLVDKFGNGGYMLYFGLLEIYAANFKPKSGWKLKVSWKFLRRKLRKSKKFLKNFLLFAKSFSKTEFNEKDFQCEEIEIVVPKFHSMADNWTKELLHSYCAVTAGNRIDKNIYREIYTNNKNIYNNNIYTNNTYILGLIEKIVADWNKFAKENRLSCMRGMSKERAKKLKERLKDKEFVNGFGDVLAKISESSFLTGNKKGSGWRVNFDWLIANDKNYLKVLEGQYDDKGTQDIFYEAHRDAERLKKIKDESVP